MKVWVFVEGESDRLALGALWKRWLDDLKSKGHGIALVPLDDKARFFRKIGPRAAEKLRERADDVVVGLPDLYPNAPFANTAYPHTDLADMKRIQTHLVRESLQEIYGVRRDEAEAALRRFHPSGFKHDMEMLLLAAEAELKAFLHSPQGLGQWQRPVENQDQQQPPKRIVETLFRTKRGKAYRDTVDAPAVLRNVGNMHSLLFRNSQPECPVFREVLDWIGERTGVPAY